MTSFKQLVDEQILSVGDGYRAKNEELGSTGPVFLRSAYLQDDGWTINEPDRLARPLSFDFGSKVAQLEDTVLTTKGNSLGRIGWVDQSIEGGVYSPHLSYWRSLDRSVLVPRFLYYWAHSSEAVTQVKSCSDSTDMAPYLSLRDQLRIEITIPAARDQQAIADVLSALDDKIALNSQMAETLETMARTVFRSWFVDFEPVRAKSEGRSTGLSDAVAALFPAKFTDDGLPYGWQATPLPKIARFLNGLALQKYAPAAGEESLPVIKIVELRTGVSTRSGRASSSIPVDYVINDGDHLFSWSGSLMHCRWTFGKGALNQHLFKVTPIGVPAWLPVEAVEHHMSAFRAIASAKAVTMGHIQRHHLDEARIALPDDLIMRAADDVIAPLHQRSFKCRMEINALTALRDTLLPKLISGELRIREAETRVAAA